MSQPESALDAALEKLREQHVRITPQRKLILDYLMTHENHPPVETIYQELAPQMASLSLATVYNTLNLFVELGIVIEIPNENGGVRYDFFGRPHYHAICENCGKVTDIYDPNLPQIDEMLQNTAKTQSGYTFNSSHIELYGLCPECQAKGITLAS
ncbi:peroxide operon transcriptional regulator [Secundilactobacillus odoratitofui DSM 19909 = JCM 15043]|uniref:Peroxide operon transcriptional regulator n=1 Tax=Secundilactobacillus odoratitofui DSM 19909 = JCM 15043 TaxID=1423776 RepID=A0A0R1LM01_9LACO|nr:Fur family transcriptional regulator [Secundilactobacillus odoratitofui]KRK96942.1 peroxide operon transcriptional regulator [Secundilactobacillus odoratitofui DSM 19909 = JCM 15043]